MTLKSQEYDEQQEKLTHPEENVKYGFRNMLEYMNWKILFPYEIKLFYKNINEINS